MAEQPKSFLERTTPKGEYKEPREKALDRLAVLQGKFEKKGLSKAELITLLEEHIKIELAWIETYASPDLGARVELLKQLLTNGFGSNPPGFRSHPHFIIIPYSLIDPKSEPRFEPKRQPNWQPKSQPNWQPKWQPKSFSRNPRLNRSGNPRRNTRGNPRAQKTSPRVNSRNPEKKP